MILVLSVSLGVIVLLSFFIIRNLLLKVEKQEDIIENQNGYVNKISNVITQSSDRLQQVDAKGTFKSDDEVGFFFNTLKDIQSILDDFKVDQYAEKKSSSNYFTKETDRWIVEYNASDNHVERDKIFREHLYYPFYKLAENIIHTFKFYYTEVDDIEDLKYEIISLVFKDKIMKFDPSKGAKAYSYFGTIIKRHLINYNNKNYNRVKKQVSIESWDTYKNDTEYEIAENTITLSQFIDLWIDETSEKVDHLFKFAEDRKIAHAVITLFSQRQGIEIFNKKAIYMYVREMTGTSTQNLTPVVKELKRLFYLRLADFQEHGMISQ